MLQSGSQQKLASAAGHRVEFISTPHTDVLELNCIKETQCDVSEEKQIRADQQIPKERGTVRKEPHRASDVSSLGIKSRASVVLLEPEVKMAGERHSASCYLDEKTFRLCCQLFLRHSVSIQDGWSWEEIKGAGEGFMRKTVLVPVRSDTCSVLTENTDSLTEELQTDVEDEAVCESPVVLRYEYHVVYSSSYQTPVLYFRVSTLDGRCASLEEVWSNVHPNYRLRLRQEPWDTLTQQEHPLLGQPFFMLHPCRTEEFMKPALDLAQTQHKRLNYIVTWLSVVGPVVGLDVPLSYSTAVFAPD